MVGTTSDWEDELGRWLEPFLERLGHRSRQRMCPLYVAGLIGPGDRKSVQPMAERLAPGDYDQLHHFVAAGVWKEAPLETELLIQADKLVGGSDAVLVIDDTSMPKKGKHSVGVAAQYASALGKTANCQTLVSLTLARGEVPVTVALRLFLPESWTSDRARLKRAGVPAEHRTVWSRSVGESAKLIPHSGRDYGPGTSRLRHDHARRPNCDTAIEGSAQGTSGAVWAEPQDSRQVA